MSQNLVVNGVTYNGVECLAMQNAEGETVAYIEGVPVPAYVKEEASRVVDAVMTREGTNLFRFIAFADAHQKNDNQDISNGNRDAGYGMHEILKLMGVDFITFLGDAAWGSSANNTIEDVKEQIKTFNRFMSPAFNGENQLRIEGNHDSAYYSTEEGDSTEKLSSAAVHALFYGYNKDVVFDPDHMVDGYCYRDFEAHKIRVIALQTNHGDGGVIKGHQLKWFAETALDMTDRTDWNVILLSHHPLDYPAETLQVDATKILNAFIQGTSLDFTTTNGTAISIDYAGKNCQFIANFHGHAHAFSVVQMQQYVDGEYVDMDAWEICIPNACFSRNNQYTDDSYADSPRLHRYTTPETYNKTADSAESTSFNVVTIALDKTMIYLDCYGAGIDREQTYQFAVPIINQISIALDTWGGTAVYNGKGYKENTRIGSDGTISTVSGMCSTGFIPCVMTDVLRLKNVTPTGTKSAYIARYKDGTFLSVSAFATVFTEQEDGSYLGSMSHATDGFNSIRLSIGTIDDTSILTINEEIT